MADISKIQIQSGTYDIKDETARNLISQLQIPDNYFDNKKIILIGDSYGEGWTPEGNVTSWQNIFISYSGINSSNVIKKYQGGAGFVNIANNKNYQTLLEEVTSSVDITDIIALGGYNDRSYNGTQISNAINAFMIKAKEKFPNAKVHIGQVGWSNDGTKMVSLTNTTSRYKWACSNYGAHYLTGIEHSLHDYFNVFSSDGFHPNANGHIYMACNLIQAFIGGSVDFMLTYSGITISPASGVTLGGFNQVGAIVKGNITEVTSQNEGAIITFNPKLNLSGKNNWVEIGTITSGFVVGSDLNYSTIPVRCVVHSDEGYFDIIGLLKFSNKKLYIGLGFKITSGNNNYQAFTNLNEIQLSNWHGIFLTDMI